MKTSWVLSDDERNRRFNKLNKISLNSSYTNKSDQVKSESPARLPELYMAYTNEEQKVLQDIRTKFGATYCTKIWVGSLLNLNHDAGMNLIEAAYDLQPVKYETWQWMQQTWTLSFSQHLLPYFTRDHNIASKDFGQLISGTNLSVAHTFKSAIIMRMGRKGEGAESICPLSEQVICKRVSSSSPTHFGLTS